MFNERKEIVTCDKHGIEFEASIFQFGGKDRISPCPECLKESEAAQAEREKAEQQATIERIVSGKFMRSGIPPRFTTRTFENFNAKDKKQEHALKMAKEYADNITSKMKSGAGLIMAGKPGTGKTHLACAVGNQFMETERTVLFITVSAMIRRIRESYRRDSQKTEQQAINEFRDIDLLIIDEIGIQKGTESEENILFEVINDRYGYFKPTIMISNLNAEEMKAYIGERALDRMREGGGKFIAFDRESYRDKVVNDENLPQADKAKYTNQLSDEQAEYMRGMIL